MFLSDISRVTIKEAGESAPVSLSTKSQGIAELVKEQSGLFAESQKIAEEIDALGKKYLADLKVLTDKQSVIAEKASAIDETLLKLVKF